MDLKVARQIARLTQQELAARSAVDHTVICALETGERDIQRMKYRDVVHLAQALGAEVTLLFPVPPVLPTLPRLIEASSLDRAGQTDDAPPA